MRRCGKVLIAASTTPALRHDDALIRARKIMHQLTSCAVIENGPNRDLEHYVFTISAGPVGSFAVRAASTFIFGIEAEVYQRVVALAGFHDDVAAASAITAGRSSTRDKLLAAESDNPVAAIAGLHPNSCL